jgi:hypothetical protein
MEPLDGDRTGALEGDRREAFESRFFSIEEMVSPAKLDRATQAFGVMGGRGGVSMVRRRSGVGRRAEFGVRSDFPLRAEDGVRVGPGFRSEVDVRFGVGLRSGVRVPSARALCSISTSGT